MAAALDNVGGREASGTGAAKHCEDVGVHDASDTPLNGEVTPLSGRTAAGKPRSSNAHFRLARYTGTIAICFG